MHWLAPESGNLDDERALILLEQEPADICMLSAAPSDLQWLAQNVAPSLQEQGLSVRLGDARPLRLSVAADDWVRKVAKRSKLILLRLLGELPYFHELLAALQRLPERRRPIIVAIPGTEAWDDDLRRLNADRQALAEAIMTWFAAGGSRNGLHLAEALRALLGSNPVPMPPAEDLPLAWDVDSEELSTEIKMLSKYDKANI